MKECKPAAQPDALLISDIFVSQLRGGIISCHLMQLSDEEQSYS